MAGTTGEKQKRQYLAGEAHLLGYGGISLINRITGMSINAIRRGIEELQQGDVYECGGPERAQGAGRPRFTDREIGILEAVEEIVSGATYGTPSKVLVWTTLSLRKISRILESSYSIRASHVMVGKALELLGYSRQCNKKMEQAGKPAPDRNEQFEYINAKAQCMKEKCCMPANQGMQCFFHSVMRISVKKCAKELFRDSCSKNLIL